MLFKSYRKLISEKHSSVKNNWYAYEVLQPPTLPELAPLVQSLLTSIFDVILRKPRFTREVWPELATLVTLSLHDIVVYSLQTRGVTQGDNDWTMLLRHSPSASRFMEPSPPTGCSARLKPRLSIPQLASHYIEPTQPLQSVPRQHLLSSPRICQGFYLRTIGGTHSLIKHQLILSLPTLMLRPKVFSHSTKSFISTSFIRFRVSRENPFSHVFVTDVTDLATPIFNTSISSSSLFNIGCIARRVFLFFRTSSTSCCGRAASVTKPGMVCSPKFLLSMTFANDVSWYWKSRRSAACVSLYPYVYHHKLFAAQQEYRPPYLFSICKDWQRNR